MPPGGDKTGLTRTLIEAYNRRDFDTCQRHLAPNGEFIPYEALGLGDVYVGEAGLRRYFEDAMSWADIHVETEGIEQLSGSVVLFHGRLVGEGSTSGAAVEAKLAWLLEFRGDQVVRCRAYESLAEAREASASSQVS